MRIRSQNDDRPYTAVPNDVIRDASMSLEARTLFALMASFHDDWVFNVNHLRGLMSIGRDRMRKATAELERRGHLIRGSMRDKITGMLCGTQWVLIDDPENYARRCAEGQNIAVGGLPDGVFLDPTPGFDGDAESTAAAPDYAIDGLPVAAQVAAAEIGAGDEKTAKSPANDRGPEIQAVGLELPRKRLEIVGSADRRPENPAVGESGPIRRTIFKKDSPLPPKPQNAAVASTPSASPWGSESQRERQRETRRSRQPKKGAGETPKPVTGGPVDEDALARQWAPIVHRGLAWAATAIRRATAQRMLELELVSPAQLRTLGVAH